MKAISLAKACIFVVLASVTFSVFANPVYIGNPAPGRHDTIFVPGHCDRHGCWRQARYIKFLQPVCARDIMWIPGQKDTCCNYVPGHYYYRGWYRPNHIRPMGAAGCSVCGS